MMRWLPPLAAVVGLFIGMALPRPAAGNLTGAQLAVALTPPTQASGDTAEINCGWHTICLPDYASGYALDWEDKKTDLYSYGNPWFFRGFFYVSDTSRTAFKMYPRVSVQDPDACDVMTVWITEIHSGQLMAIPTYTHVNITYSTSFSWKGSPWTTYNNRPIGVTINENNPDCSTGSHVHESHVDYLTNLVTITRNTGLYPTAQQCHIDLCSRNNPPYGPYTTNNINNWTRRFAWAEGACQHAPGPCK